MFKKIWIELSMEHLKDNYQTIQGGLASKQLMPVVKANAYGHGLLEMANFFDQQDPAFLCVADISEALLLVEAGIKSDILIFSKTSSKQIEAHHHPQFVYSLISEDWLKSLKVKDSLRLHIKYNVGMNRMGIKDKNELARILASASPHRIEGLYTHFSSKEKSSLVQAQVHDFLTVAKKHRKQVQWIHVGNSPSSLYSHELIDAYRFGMAFYGYHAFFELKPVLSLYAQVVHKDLLEVEDYVSYDFSYQQKEHPAYFASIAAGYALGLDQRLAELPVVINHQSYPIVGKVCMDQTVILVDDKVAIGDRVELISNRRPLEKLAASSGVSVYEILSRLEAGIERIKE